MEILNFPEDVLVELIRRDLALSRLCKHLYNLSYPYLFQSLRIRTRFIPIASEAGRGGGALTDTIIRDVDKLLSDDDKSRFIKWV